MVGGDQLLGHEVAGIVETEKTDPGFGQLRLLAVGTRDDSGGLRGLGSGGRSGGRSGSTRFHFCRQLDLVFRGRRPFGALARQGQRRGQGSDFELLFGRGHLRVVSGFRLRLLFWARFRLGGGGHRSDAAVDHGLELSLGEVVTGLRTGGCRSSLWLDRSGFVPVTQIAAFVVVVFIFFVFERSRQKLVHLLHGSAEVSTLAREVELLLEVGVGAQVFGHDCRVVATAEEKNAQRTLPHRLPGHFLRRVNSSGPVRVAPHFGPHRVSDLEDRLQGREERERALEHRTLRVFGQ